MNNERKYTTYDQQEEKHPDLLWEAIQRLTSMKKFFRINTKLRVITLDRLSHLSWIGVYLAHELPMLSSILHALTIAIQCYILTTSYNKIKYV